MFLSHPIFYINILNLFYSTVSYSIIFIGAGDCNTINSYDEGVEFSARLLSMPEEWIPITYVFRSNDRNNAINISDGGGIRGYEVNEVLQGGNNSTEDIKVDICNFNISDSIQFRWLQTSSIASNDFLRDVWILDNLEISINTCEHGTVQLLKETFDEGILK